MNAPIVAIQVIRPISVEIIVSVVFARSSASFTFDAIVVSNSLLTIASLVRLVGCAGVTTAAGAAVAVGSAFSGWACAACPRKRDVAKAAMLKICVVRICALINSLEGICLKNGAATFVVRTLTWREK